MDINLDFILRLSIYKQPPALHPHHYKRMYCMCAPIQRVTAEGQVEV